MPLDYVRMGLNIVFHSGNILKLIWMFYLKKTNGCFVWLLKFWTTKEILCTFQHKYSSTLCLLKHLHLQPWSLVSVFGLYTGHHWCAVHEDHFSARRSSLLYLLLLWLTLRRSLRRNGIAIVAQDSYRPAATTSSASPLSHLCVYCEAVGRAAVWECSSE